MSESPQAETPDAATQQRREYEEAVTAFQAADKAYLAAQEDLLSGQVVAELAVSYHQDIPFLLKQWALNIQQLQTLLEDRNAKLQSAKLALRGAVQLGPNQWRGIDAKPTSFQLGPFTTTSVTSRGVNVEALFDLAKTYGLLDRLMELTTTNKDGTPCPVVRQEWDIDYAYLMTWLKANKLTKIMDGIYDEKEGTPQVKGPKPLAFLGTEIKG